jgi:hypothetical protein
MMPSATRERRAAAGEAGAADVPEWRVVTIGVALSDTGAMTSGFESTNACRAGFAGRGTTFACTIQRTTLGFAFAPRRSLGAVF